MVSRRFAWTNKLTFQGVKSYEVSLDTQTANVVAAEDLSYETVLEKIKKTGKAVTAGEADGVKQAV